MNKYLATASALAMLIAGPALAADQQKNAADADVKVIEKTQGDADVKVIREGANANAQSQSQGQMQGQTQAAATQQQPNQIDASELIGKDIENAAGDDVGEVNSVILSQDGQVQAVIVGVGGFLGIGQRDVAINWEDLNVSNNGEQIVANITREQLEQMPEYQFAEDQQRGTAFEGEMAERPAAEGQNERMAAAPAEPRGEMNVGAGNQARSSDSPQSGATATTATGAGAQSGAAATATDGQASEAAQTQQQAANAKPMDQLGQMSADEIIGRDVVNLRGENVGDIEDVVLGQDNALFAVISVGGFLGMGDKNVAVPVNELRLGENDVIMMSETTEEQLETMPEFDKSAYQPFERNQRLGGQQQ